MNKRSIACFVGAAVSAVIGWFLPEWLLPADAGFSLICVIAALQETLMLFVPAVLLFARKGDPIKQVRALFQKVNAYLAGMTMLTAVSFSLTGALITALGYILLTQFGITPTLPAAVVPQNLAELVLATLCMAALTAVCEELFFRGLIQGLLQKRFSVGISMWVTGILFAALHFNLLAFPVILIIGLILSRLMMLKGILLPIVFHAVYNFSIILINYSGSNPGLGVMLICVAIFSLSSRFLFKEANREVSHEM